MRAGLTHHRPSYGIDTVMVGKEATPVREEVAAHTAFAELLRALAREHARTRSMPTHPARRRRARRRRVPRAATRRARPSRRACHLRTSRSSARQGPTARRASYGPTGLRALRATPEAAVLSGSRAALRRRAQVLLFRSRREAASADRTLATAREALPEMPSRRSPTTVEPRNRCAAARQGVRPSLPRGAHRLRLAWPRALRGA